MRAIPVFSARFGSSLPLPFGLVPKKYRTRKRGKYAAGVFECPHCGHGRWNDESGLVGIGKHSQEFSDGGSEDQAVWVWECQKCFEHYWHHLSCGEFQTYHWRFELNQPAQSPSPNNTVENDE